MQIEFIITNIPSQKFGTICRNYNEILQKISGSFNTVRFLGICEVDDAFAGIIEFNLVKYAVPLRCFRHLKIETLGDFFKIKHCELTVCKDGDKFYFELA